MLVSLSEYAPNAVGFADRAGVALLRIGYDGDVEACSDAARALLDGAGAAGAPAQASPPACDNCHHEWVDIAVEWADEGDLAGALAKDAPVEVTFEVPGADANPYVELLCANCSARARHCDGCQAYLGFRAPAEEHSRRATSEDEAHEAGYTDVLDRGPFVIWVDLCPSCYAKVGRRTGA